MAEVKVLNIHVMDWMELDRFHRRLHNSTAGLWLVSRQEL